MNATNSAEKLRVLGTIVTFYSFKGGVGRSMAVANVAILLARAGKRVLCVDWDLEAPGLDRYLGATPRSTPNAGPKLLLAKKTGGLLGILKSSSPGNLVRWQEFIRVRIGSDEAKLDFIGCGDDHDNYSENLADFSWATFFEHNGGGDIIEGLRDAWKESYDYVLIDSRTGLTDSSGVCTIQMPDLVVMLFAANEQNVNWCRRIAKGIREGRSRLPYERTFLPIIPLLSRFDAREESDRAAEAMDRIAIAFETFFQDWLPRSIAPRDMLAWSVLPYIPRYSFEEAVAVEDEPETGAQGLSFYYHLLSRLIDSRFNKVRSILASVGVPGAALPPLLPNPRQLDLELGRDLFTVERYLKSIKERAEEDPVEAALALESIAAACVTTSRFQDAELLLTEAIAILSQPSVAKAGEISRLKRKRADIGASFDNSWRSRPGQLTAMISSTALDLPEHRAAVKEACLSAGIFPISVEHLPARDISATAVSLEMVDKADIYLGIYGWRYGWVPNGKELSVIEMEFDHALERKAAGKLRELLIFTAHDDHPVTKKDIEATERAQKKLAAFKAKATSGRIRRDFKSVEELRRLVSQALEEFKVKQTAEHNAAVSSPTVPTTSIPHNLPTLQPFFGREDELRKIADALDPDSRTWGALIDGPGGMGKTSLAIRAAYDASPDLFKKIIFISLKTRELDDDGVRDLSGFILSGLVELFNELARELGCEDIAKAPEDQRPRLLLDSLRGTQTLLVLDNLESLIKSERDTLFTFVKKLPTGCKAILTSRGRIGSGAEELILEKLSEEAALSTLAELATHNPLLAQTNEAERLVLYRETAGRPLLLRWTAGQLGRGHCLTFTDALHFIRSCPLGNDPLEFVFGDLVEDFDEHETKTLCALSYFTLPASVEHVGAISGLLPPEADRALRSLATRSLVVPTEELKTFTLVPTVADFIRQKKPEAVAEIGERLEKHAYALIMENGWDNSNRFHILVENWPLIAATFPIFIQGPNKILQDITIALQQPFRYAGRWDEQLALSTKAEEKAVKSQDFIHAGLQAYNIAVFYRNRRQSKEVLKWANKAASHWIEGQAKPRLLGHGHNDAWAESSFSRRFFRGSGCLSRNPSALAG